MTAESKPSSWNEPSLFEWAERMLRAGSRELVRDVVRTLPKHAREKYIDLYNRIKAEQKKAEGA